MKISPVSFNNNAAVNRSNRKAGNIGTKPAFRGGESDYYVVREKPTFWNKYKGWILSFAGFVGGQALSERLLKKNHNIVTSIIFGLGGMILGNEIADRL